MRVAALRAWGRLPAGRTVVATAVAAAVLAPAPPVRAEVLMSERAALERAFPGLTPERRTLYLTPAQVTRVEQAARSRLPSPVVTAFVARRAGQVVGYAVLDTHVVRTRPETVLTVIEPGGRLRAVFVLQFGEPPDYLPRERWLDTLAGRPLDDELWPGRGVRRVTGATLTVQAITAATRRALALQALVLGDQAP